MLVWRVNQKNQRRIQAMKVTSSRGEPIIEAIHRYSKEHRAPPPSLEALIPGYLSAIPDPGALAVGGWRYSNDSEQDGGWSLVVAVKAEYSPFLFDYEGDRFVFHPNGKYLDRDDYRDLEPFGKWGYYTYSKPM
jgi:hypothetical protein